MRRLHRKKRCNNPPSAPRKDSTDVSLSVLVVDDDASVLRLMETRLSSMGYRTAIAPDGLDALEFLGDQPTDQRNGWVLLLDIAMPHTDGIATCSILREQGFSGKILAHTSTDSHTTRKVCEQVGFDGYLVKPVDAESLQAAIQSLFDEDKLAA